MKGNAQHAERIFDIDMRVAELVDIDNDIRSRMWKLNLRIDEQIVFDRKLVNEGQRNYVRDEARLASETYQTLHKKRNEIELELARLKAERQFLTHKIMDARALARAVQPD